jgi:hypothetical protein
MSTLKDMLVEFILAPKLHSVVSPHILVSTLSQVLCPLKATKPLHYIIFFAKI